MSKDLFYRCQSERIYFKRIDINDLDLISSIITDQDTIKYTAWPYSKSKDESLEYLNKLIKRNSKQDMIYATVFTKEDNQSIGVVMMFNFDEDASHCEIGYIYKRKLWNKGYGSEAVKLLEDYSFRVLKLNKVYATIIDINVGSAKILTKNGFSLEAELKDHFVVGGNYCNLQKFSKFNTNNRLK